MRILTGCECSGRVREALRALGHDAWSCDLLDTEIPGQHIRGDIRDVLKDKWDMMIAFPPCTHLAVSGAKHFAAKRADGRQKAAIDFFMEIITAPIPMIAVENPIGIMSTIYRKPDQIVQPWMFGDEATKTTCLWLKNLPLLEPTKIVGKGARHITKSGKSLPEWYNIPPTCKNRAGIRSKTFPGIANAMANQWGKTKLNLTPAPAVVFSAGYPAQVCARSVLSGAGVCAFPCHNNNDLVVEYINMLPSICGLRG